MTVDPMHFLILVVRLWHDSHRWEPGLVYVKPDWYVTKAAKAAQGNATYITEGMQPAWEIWYAPKPWGGRGFQCCTGISLLALRKAMSELPGPSPQRELFSTSKLTPDRPQLVCSTKLCTARPDIPPFLDSDAASAMMVQFDWALDRELVLFDNKGYADHPWTLQHAFELVAHWRERELRAEIAKLRALKWGDGCLDDPRKVTLASRSARRAKNPRVNA